MIEQMKSKIEELKQKVALLKDQKKKTSFQHILENDFDSETLKQ